MSIPVVFMIYLTLFRLTMIAAGVVSIVLGYRLFCQGTAPSQAGKQGTAAAMTIPGGARFTLKNAAPGTCFALFGVILISVMVVKGGPELALETLKAAELVKDPSGQGGGTTLLRLRGDDSHTLYDLIQRGEAKEALHDAQGAMAAYQEALTLMATPMNQLAWLYQQQGKAAEGLLLARLAVQLRPDKTAFLDTLAATLCKAGQHAEALSFLEKAVQMEPGQFGPRLAQLRSGVCPE